MGGFPEDGSRSWGRPQQSAPRCSEHDGGPRDDWMATHTTGGKGPPSESPISQLQAHFPRLLPPSSLRDQEELSHFLDAA